MKNLLKRIKLYFVAKDMWEAKMADPILPRRVNPYKPCSKEEIYDELARSRECFEKGEYKEFDVAIDEIRKKYGL